MNNKRKFIFKTLWGLGLALFTLLATQCTDTDAPELRAPDLTIEDVRNETRNSAVFSGSVYSNGGNMDECGFFYSSSESDLQKSLLTSDSPRATKVIVSPKSGKLETIIENLKSGTTYYYCIYAKSGKTMVVSDIKKFETPKESKPELNSVEVLEVAEYSIKVRSSIKDQGGASLTNFGFEYRKINETAWKGQLVNSFDEGSENQFTITLTGLEANTEYVIRASATNSVDTNTSDEIRQKTNELTAPIVKTLEPADTDLGATWVKVMGIIENIGASDEIVNRGFCYSLTNKEPTINDTRHIVESESNEFSLTITNLMPQTTYYLRAFAANKVDGNTKYGYGNVIMFETSAYKSTTFTEVKVDEIAASSARLNCTITPGTGVIEEKGFCYSFTSTKPEKENNPVFVNGESNEMKTTVEGLDENKKYFVRAFVTSKNAAGEKETVYSGVTEFKTIAFESASFTDLTIEDVTKHTAKATVVINAGTTTIVEKGFCWRISDYQLPDITKNDPKLKIEGTEFTGTLTGLSDGTTYKIRAYAICKRGNKEETVYSAVKEFTTKSYSLPTFSGMTSSDVTKTNATLSVSMTEGDVTIVEKGFCWNTESSPTTENFKISVEGNEFKSTISNLKYGTLYYCRAYAIYKKGNNEETKTVYSGQTYFTTSSYKTPSFSSLKSDSITKTSVVLSVNMDAGEATIVEKGFCWGTSDYPTTADSTTVVNGDKFRATLSGLAVEQKYYYRAYATYKLGNDETETTTYSSSYSFTTKNYKVGTIDLKIEDIELYSAKLVGDYNPEGADDITIVEKGFIWSTKGYPSPSDNEGKQVIEGDDFSCTMENLSPNTRYYVRAYIKIEERPDDFWYDEQYFETKSLAKPSFSEWENYLKLEEVTSSSFTVKGKLYNVGTPAATEVGFCWTTKEGLEPEEFENKQSATLGEDKTFTLTVKDLPSGTVYYVYAYATNEVGTAYSPGYVTATTKRSPADEDNANPDKIK